MKLSFSTLGCPDWDFDTIIKKAVEYGFDGIEMRGVQRQLDVTALPEFKQNAKETIAKLKDAGLKIVCFSSSVLMSFANPADEQKHLDELKRYAELSDVFNVPFIRIFGGEIGDQTIEEAMPAAVTLLRKMTDIVKKHTAKIALETHDDWMAADDMKALMENVNSDKLGILWDVNHPFMFLGEDPNETWDKTKKWIYHTHWKDSAITIDTIRGFEPCLMGEGDLPHQQIYDVLKKGGYNGYYSLEWEKMWHPELPGPEIAFPQYIKYMKELMK